MELSTQQSTRGSR